jgi:hypothetical protein
MKPLVLIPLFTLFSLFSFGQISFEKGYIIDNQNRRIEYLIKNVDWKDNPKEFEYKTSGGREILKGDLSSVKEFGVIGFSKFVRSDVKMDISRMGGSDLSKQRDPEWEQKQLFLKVLVEGKATLYEFESGPMSRYFYSVSDSISQLIYKEYYKNSDEIAVNNGFHDQLWTNARWANTTTSVIEQISYRKSDLVKYFKNFNECRGDKPIVYGENNSTKKHPFHFRVTAGLNYTSMSISSNLHSQYNVDFGSQLEFRGGIEAEYILPFNRNKWALLVEPTYQYYNATNQSETLEATIHYNTIEFPIGLRYYFFLNPELKVFIDAYAIPGFDVKINSSIQYHYNYATLWETSTSGNFAFGGGIGYKRFSAEIRYYTNRDFLVDISSMFTKYQRISAIFGFKLF